MSVLPSATNATPSKAETSVGGRVPSVLETPST
jgi:hypothetical protein